MRGNPAWSTSECCASGAFGSGKMLRVADGNDRLATEIARRLSTPVRLRAVLRKVRQSGDRVLATAQRDLLLKVIRAAFGAVGVAT